jgi:hypothetical protein
MLKNKKLLFIAIVACLVSSVGAQETTNSPYSRYGYGMLRDQAVGPSKAMGGIGYGLRHAQSANPMNPASHSRVDSLTFLFDIGISSTYGKLSDGVNSKNHYNGGLDYITILIPLTRGLGVSAGILPYSSVGYKFGSKETTNDLSYIKSFSGSGGLSQVYLGAGYKLPGTGLSLGANASYLFGTVEHTRSLPSIGSSDSYTSTEHSMLKLNTFKFDLGLQYELTLSKKDKLTIGAVYSPKINSKGDYENIHYELNSSGVAVSRDTTAYNGVDAGIPATYGAGFSLNRDNKLIIGADVTYQKWNDVKYSEYMGDGIDQSDRFNDRWKYAVGAEYMIDPYDRSFFKRIKFRGGVNYSNSYMNVKNSDNKVKGYDEYGATLGFGFPIRDNLGGRLSYININFEYKKVKPKISNMISEQYFGVSLNMNINEFWFFRKKID